MGGASATGLCAGDTYTGGDEMARGGAGLWGRVRAGEAGGGWFWRALLGGAFGWSVAVAVLELFRFFRRGVEEYEEVA